MTADVEPGHSVAALVAAGGIMAVSVLAVVLVGIRPLPALPRAADAPAPELTGEIVYVRVAGERWCLEVVAVADGAARQIVCDDADDEFGSPWLASGRDGSVVVVRGGEGGDEVADLDAAAGRLGPWSTGGDDALDREKWFMGGGPDTAARDDGARLDVVGDGGRVRLDVVSQDQRRTVMELEGPRSYWLWGESWMQDGRGAVVADNRGRLLVVDTGSPGGSPRIAAEDVESWIVVGLAETAGGGSPLLPSTVR